MSARRRPWDRLTSSSTMRGISVIASGSVAAQLVVVLASPLLTRLYTPEEFGFLAVFSALLNTLLVVSSLRYQVAVPLAEERRQAIAVVVLSVVVVALFSLVLLLAVFVGGERFAESVNAPAHAAWLYLLPLAVLLAGWFQVFRMWALRSRAFADLAKSKIQQSLAMTLVQLLGFRFGVAALLVGQVIGRFSGMARLVLPFHRAAGKELRTLSVRELTEQARRYRRFPLYSTWGTLLNASSRQFPAVFFAAVADPAIAGLYALSQRVLATPLSFVSDSISSVFTSIAAEARDERHLRRAVESFNAALCLLAAVPIVALMLLGPDVFALAFGEQWREAGVFSAIMAPWIYLVFVSTPLMIVFSLRERDSELSLFQLVLALARVAALFAGWALGGVLSAIALYAGVSSLIHVAMIARVHRLADSTVLRAFRTVFGSLALGVVVLCPLWLQSASGIGGADGRLVAVSLATLSGLGYYAWLATRLSAMVGHRP